MRVFTSFEDVSDIIRPVVTVGSFDGVHLGHRAIIEAISGIADKIDGQSVVVTFDPHPRFVLQPDEPMLLINTLPEKLHLLAAVGVDNVIVIPFSKEFSRISYHQFVSDFLVDILHLDTLLIGYNHHLGHNKEGSTSAIEEMSMQMGFTLRQMPQQSVTDILCGSEDGLKLSSTTIRHFIMNGDLDSAAEYLGEPYFFFTVTDKEGCIQGVDQMKLLPPNGMYKVAVELNSNVFSARLLIKNGAYLTLQNTPRNFSNSKLIVKFV